MHSLNTVVFSIWLYMYFDLQCLYGILHLYFHGEGCLFVLHISHSPDINIIFFSLGIHIHMGFFSHASWTMDTKQWTLSKPVGDIVD